jgi:hypothetical protein
MYGYAFAIRQMDSGGRTGAASAAPAFEEPVMRETLATLRDVMVALLLQVVFRATILLRRWNY